VAANGLVLLAFAFIPALLGMAARLLYPDLDRADLALPALMSGALPPAVGALALAAVFSAEISTADAVLFMLATSASRDLYAGFINRQATDAQTLRAARVAAIAGAVAGVALAFMFSSVIAALDAFYALLTVTLFVPVIAALHTRTSAVHGLTAIGCGLPALIAVYLLTDARGYGMVTPALAGILASGVGFAIAKVSRP
jgi:SSS family solute:Na+ symporter